jgi:photosystem II stability/assembly factor-like uncharacterized protein
MKKYFRKYAGYAFALGAAILFTACGVLLASGLPESWREINAGFTAAGVGVGTLVIDPEDTATIYARTYSGKVFKSTDGGANWRALSNILGVNSLVIDPTMSSKIYVGTDHGVFKSTDRGRSWTSANTGLIAGSITKVAIDATTTSTLYAVAFDGIFKSTNAGTSWVGINTGLPSNAYIQSIAVDPIVSSAIYVSYGLPNSGGRLMKSIDGGENWNVIATSGGMDVNRMAFDPTTSSTVYLPARNGIFKSIDAGMSWNLVNAGLPPDAFATSVVVDPATPSTIYVSYTFNFNTGGGIAKSMDGGRSGNLINTGLPPNIPVSSLAIDPTTRDAIYAGTYIAGLALGAGVFKSTDGGASWNAANTGLMTTDIRALTIDPLSATTVYAGGVGGLYKSNNNGENWTRLLELQIPAPSFPPGIPPPPFGAGPGSVQSVVIDFLNPNTVYTATQRIGGCAFSDQLLFKTTDGGAHWDNRVSPDRSGCVLSGLLVMDPTDPNTLYVDESDPIDAGGWLLKTTDGGSTWNTIWDWRRGLEFALNALVIDPTNSATLYAGSDDEYFSAPGVGGLFKSIDGGVNWSKTSLGDTAVSALAMDPTNSNTLYAATENFYSKPKGFRGLFKSTDSGVTWVAINTGLEVVLASRFRLTWLVIDPTDSNIIYAATAGGGIFRTSDGGVTWSPFNDGLGNLDVRVLAFAKGDAKTLYAGTSGGVFAVRFDSPLLTLESRKCLGDSWTLRVSNGTPSAPVRLLGTTNGQSWEVAGWLTTDATGAAAQQGSFTQATLGTHTLRVEIGGVSSNAVSFVVSNCR